MFLESNVIFTVFTYQSGSPPSKWTKTKHILKWESIPTGHDCKFQRPVTIVLLDWELLGDEARNDSPESFQIAGRSDPYYRLCASGLPPHFPFLPRALIKIASASEAGKLYLSTLRW